MYLLFSVWSYAEHIVLDVTGAKIISLRVDKNGEEHEPTKDSVILALRYLNKPFLNTVWDASIQESDNLVAGKTKSNVWTAYIKNIAMVNYIGLTYFDSDFFNHLTVYCYYLE